MELVVRHSTTAIQCLLCSFNFTVRGEEFIYERLGIGNGTTLSDWDLWVNVVALSSIVLGMFVLTYIQLRITKTTT